MNHDTDLSDLNLGAAPAFEPESDSPEDCLLAFADESALARGEESDSAPAPLPASPTADEPALAPVVTAAPASAIRTPAPAVDLAQPAAPAAPVASSPAPVPPVARAPAPIAPQAPEDPPLDRLSDFKGPYAAKRIALLAAEARANETLARVLELEDRLSGGLRTLLDRVDQVLDRSERAQASLALASDLLGQQAKIIANAFREQLTATEANGVATLRTHLLEVADQVANKATSAMNQVADEAAAVAGVKAEAAALQRVTGVVLEQAKKAGLDQAVLALTGILGRLQQAAEQIEQLPAHAPAAAPRPAAPQAQPQGLGALSLAWMWIRHQMGAPGAVIGLVAIALAIWKIWG